MKKIALLVAAFSLSACSIFKGGDDEIIFDTALGPQTKNQIKTLPGSLKGDSENARYSSEKKVGNDMDAGSN